ncbi:uncharacterized protein HKW66_Vig0184850 [Vigna angularis]|nr:uncharacterized protein HKW66_Vig0184850 [Vigna angularis]
MGNCGMLVLLLMLLISKPTTLAELSSEGSLVQHMSPVRLAAIFPPTPPTRPTRRMRPPIDTPGIGIPNPHPRPPPTNGPKNHYAPLP